MRLSRLLVAVVGLCVAAVSSPAEQTAEGAQKFLQSVAQNGKAVAYVVEVVPMVLTVTYDDGRPPRVENAEYRFISASAGIRPGKNACFTRVESIAVDVSYPNLVENVAGTRAESVWRYRGTGAFRLDMDIDWGSAVIKRGAWVYSTSGYKYAFYQADRAAVTVEYGGKAFEYLSDDPEMLDRLEYAMKFLQASCDKTADTGF